MTKRSLTSFLIFSIVCFNLSHTTLAQSSSAIVKDAQRFLKTLKPEEVKQATFAFSDTMRIKWTNLPLGLVPRPGIQYGSLSDSSKMAFHRYLTTLLSSQGYLKITSLMQLDDILNLLMQESFDKGKLDQKTLTMFQSFKWGYNNYYIAVFGDPQSKDPWSLNFGGHHIALNMTARGESISVSPLFLGTDPDEIKFGKYAGLRVLSKEEDYGFTLLNFLTDGQKKVAVLSKEVPHDIITNPKANQRITDFYGIAAKEFNKDQKAILEILIQEYIHNFEHETAHRLYEKITKTGLDKIYFAWIGSPVRDKPHYYILHGPDFLIEYDNFQGGGNHIHLILRETGNDFGADILKEHYLTSEHHKN